MKLRILLADDHNLVRQALRKLLDGEPDFELVGEAKNGLQVEDKVVKHRPDVVLLDVMMPGLHGFEVLRRLRLRHPRIRVLMLSMHTDEAYVLRALEHGASGYVVKNADAQELIHAVREVGAGREYLSAPFTDLTIEAYRRKAASRSTDPYEDLTPREKEVLQLIAEGCTNKEAARRLFINERTIETHRAHFMEKLKLRNLADLVRFAMERGLVEMQGPPPEDPGDGEPPSPDPRKDLPPSSPPA